MEEIETKVEKYFGLLYPEYDSLSPEEKLSSGKDHRFIIGNLDVIESYYQMYINNNGQMRTDMSSSEIMREVMKHAKIDRYFETLYPNYNLEHKNEQFLQNIDKRFIMNNLDAIDSYYYQYSDSSSQMYMGQNEQEKVEEAVKHAKVDRYFEILHPEYAKATPDEQFDLNKDKFSIIRNFDKVDDDYKEACLEHSKDGFDAEEERKVLQDSLDKSKQKSTLSMQSVVRNAVISGLDKDDVEKGNLEVKDKSKGIEGERKDVR